MKYPLRFSFAVPLLLACNRDPTGESPGRVAPPPSTPHAVAPLSVPARTVAAVDAESRAQVASLYDLPIPLLDESGTVKPLDAFRGHPVLITMFYGSCASACPLLTFDLKRIERQIPEPTRSELRILMVSFDAARDTPPVLARLMKERSMDPARWSLASATDDGARELAGVLNIKYRKLDGGEFFHSSAIILLDAQGRPRARLDGLGKDAAPILSALTGPST